ncbi:MAG TPA: hypothetical protein VNZ01_10395 [Solirubrobacteraceae bacterium]|nr:hypothetical protein [Solirubrobacteraceae bacterium]
MADEVVFSYDRFEVEEYTVPNFSSSLPSPKIGSSFRHVFDGNLRGFEERLHVREGDVCNIGWHGEPIELLFLDILKSWEINDLFLNQFFGCLIPGAVVVQQDYAYGFCPWIHITMELLSDYFTWISYVPHASYVYVLEREIPESLLRLQLRSDLSRNEKRTLMERAVARADGEVKAMLQLAQTMLLLEIGPRRQAIALHEQVKREFPDSEPVQACAQASEPWVARARAVRSHALADALIDACSGKWRSRALRFRGRPWRFQ